MRKHIFGSVLAASLTVAATSAMAAPLQQNENFSTFTSDAGPDSVGNPTNQNLNRTPPLNFGFSATNNVNGGAGPTGEMGGTVVRTAGTGIRGSYGVMTGLFENLETIAPGEIIVTATGQARGTGFVNTTTDVRFFFGFFGSTNANGDFIGLRLNGRNGFGGVRLQSAPGPNGGTTASSGLNVTANFDFTLTRAAVGSGANLTGSFNGTNLGTVVVSEANLSSIDLDSFGIVSENGGINESANVYFDNLNFSVVPEPAGLAALGAGALIALRRRRA